MYDSDKIIPGLVIFVLLMLSPVIKGCVSTGTIPKPEKPVGMKNCIRDTQYMRASHMQMLNDWRDEVIREGKREKQLVDGKEYTKSLQNTCMKCHTSKKKFCDNCHEYTAVNPYCWDCHIQPKEKE